MNTKNKYCNVCDLRFKHPSNLLTHEKTEKHKTNQKLQEENPSFLEERKTKQEGWKKLLNETLPKIKEEKDIFHFKAQTRQPTTHYEGFRIIESSNTYSKIYKTFVKEYKIISDKPTDNYENVVNETIRIVKERTAYNPVKDKMNISICNQGHYISTGWKSNDHNRINDKLRTFMDKHEERYQDTELEDVTLEFTILKDYPRGGKGTIIYNMEKSIHNKV